MLDSVKRFGRTKSAFRRFIRTGPSRNPMPEPGTPAAARPPPAASRRSAKRASLRLGCPGDPLSIRFLGPLGLADGPERVVAEAEGSGVIVRAGQRGGGQVGSFGFEEESAARLEDAGP